LYRTSETTEFVNHGWRAAPLALRVEAGNVEAGNVEAGNVEAGNVEDV
jgi:hypothetical protein